MSTMSNPYGRLEIESLRNYPLQGGLTSKNKKILGAVIGSIMGIAVILIIALVPCYSYCSSDKDVECGDTGASCSSWKGYCKTHKKCANGKTCSNGKCTGTPTDLYSCNTSTGVCAVDKTGGGTDKKTCDDTCKAPPDTKYSCDTSTGICAVATSGGTTEAICSASCYKDTWGCSTDGKGTCGKFTDGTGHYTTANSCQCWYCDKSKGDHGACAVYSDPTKPGSYASNADCTKDTDAKCGWTFKCPDSSARFQRLSRKSCADVADVEGNCVLSPDQNGADTKSACNQATHCGWSYGCNGTETCTQSYPGGGFSNQADCTCYTCDASGGKPVCKLVADGEKGTLKLSDCDTQCGVTGGYVCDATLTEVPERAKWDPTGSSTITDIADTMCWACSSNACNGVTDSTGHSGQFHLSSDCSGAVGKCGWGYSCDNSADGTCSLVQTGGKWSSADKCECWKCSGDPGPSSSCVAVSDNTSGTFVSKDMCTADTDAKCSWKWKCAQ